MSDSKETENNQDSTFLQRWSRRKQAQAKQSDTKMTAPMLVDAKPDVEPSGPLDVPDIDMLDENSEVSVFFSEQVSETLKRQALRKLFHMDKFNFCDGLDDYAEDYTLFEPLGNIITAHQRLQEERQAINRLVNNEEEPPAETREPHEPQEMETTLEAQNGTATADEHGDEPAPADPTELKEG